MDGECNCETCRALAAGASREGAWRQMQERHKKEIQRHGYIAHVLTEGPLAHTHGLQENFDHPDLEVRLSVAPQERGQLLSPLAEAVKNGMRFKPGEEDRKVFNVPVRFIESAENGRQVLRAVFPDPEGRFPGDKGCMPEYAEQQEMEV